MYLVQKLKSCDRRRTTSINEDIKDFVEHQYDPQPEAWDHLRHEEGTQGVYTFTGSRNSMHSLSSESFKSLCRDLSANSPPAAAMHPPISLPLSSSLHDIHPAAELAFVCYFNSILLTDLNSCIAFILQLMPNLRTQFPPQAITRHFTIEHYFNRVDDETELIWRGQHQYAVFEDEVQTKHGKNKIKHRRSDDGKGKSTGRAVATTRRGRADDT
ncbi:hypothetical protein BC936DRAFT_150158 [Jimgerdemannia flammicorona]|uniref:Uncharacterized protein n=1 Tax=Jimgerdemannia flammicorona TaxID=994334 RepID=A0A433CZD9_9FUNG|nr:hypothetical protein BC936DRAFT_150158 [Jimgerdemannia flammicorona]